MSKIKLTDEMRQACYDGERCAAFGGTGLQWAEAIITAVAPLILEQAAQLAESHEYGSPKSIAAAIRAMSF